MRGVISAVVWGITPAYFLVGWFFKTQWTEEKRAEEEQELSFGWIAAFMIFATMLIIYMVGELKELFVVGQKQLMKSSRRFPNQL